MGQQQRQAYAALRTAFNTATITIAWFGTLVSGDALNVFKYF